MFITLTREEGVVRIESYWYCRVCKVYNYVVYAPAITGDLEAHFITLLLNVLFLLLLSLRKNRTVKKKKKKNNIHSYSSFLALVQQITHLKLGRSHLTLSLFENSLNINL